jgi:hypothetical protein
MSTREASREGKHPSIHIRLPPEELAVIERCMVALRERKDMPITRTMAIRQMMAAGGREILRDRKTRKE